MPRHLYRTPAAGSFPSARYFDKRKGDNARLLGMYLVGVCGMLGAGILCCADSYAAGPSITFGEVTTTGSNEIELEDSGTTVGHYYATLPIGFTNTDTYSIYVYGDTELVGTEDSSNKIYALGQNRTATTITEETNAWGYRAHFGLATEGASSIETVLGVKSYTGVKKESSKDIIVDHDTIDGDYNGKITVEFVAAIDGSVGADEYSGEVYVSAVATPKQLTIFSLTNMQDMSTEACENTPTPTPGAAASATSLRQAKGKESYNGANFANYNSSTNTTSVVPWKTGVVDVRDSKTYTIVKLADGHCWMHENLKYTPVKDIVLSETQGTDFNGDSTKSWKVPTDFNASGARAIYPVNDTYSSAYYTWEAATVGTGKDLTTNGNNANSSICPKGWRLPTGASAALTSNIATLANGNFQNLIDVYSAGSDHTKLMSEPLNFPMAGTYDASGSLFYAGSNGRYWSSTSQGTLAYRLGLDSNSVTPQYCSGFDNGLTVRCIAR